MTCVKVGGWRVTIERGEEKRGEGGKGGGSRTGSIHPNDEWGAGDGQRRPCTMPMTSSVAMPCRNVLEERCS